MGDKTLESDRSKGFSLLKSEPKGSIPNLFMGIFNLIQHRRIVILIILCLSFKFNGIAFGYLELHLGHQFLPVYFDVNRMVRTFGVALWDTLYTRWSFGINVRFQSYRHVFKNKEYPEWGPPKYIIRLREYMPYLTIDYTPYELSEKAELYTGLGAGVLVTTRQNISPRIVKIVDNDTTFGELLPLGYEWEDFEVPRISAWVTPYIGIRYYIPTRGIILSLSLGSSHGFGRTELNNYLLLLGSIAFFTK